MRRPRRRLKEEPNFPDYVPEPAKELMKKLLSKRPLLRPALGDVLKDSWLAEHAPQQQEILKLQQPAPFSTQLEKDTLQRCEAQELVSIWSSSMYLHNDATLWQDGGLSDSRKNNRKGETTRTKAQGA